MQLNLVDNLPDDMTLILLADAARIAGRSYSWARDRWGAMRLERAPDIDGRHAVTARSLRATLPYLRRCVGRPRLRLVVDNT